MTSNEFHERALKLSNDYRRCESELLSTLMEMRREKAFLSLGYSGIYDYCVRALRLSEAQAFYFKKVAEKSEEVPELKLAIEVGTLSIRCFLEMKKGARGPLPKAFGAAVPCGFTTTIKSRCLKVGLIR